MFFSLIKNGKKGSCFSGVKKVLCTEKKKKKKQNQNSGKWFRKKSVDLDSSSAHTTTMDQSKSLQMRFVEAENDQNKHSYTTALATAVTARELGESKEEFAAIKIQTVFRGYLARRGFRALKGLVRLKKMIEGQSVKRQTTSALRYMHTLAHVQSETRTRRIRMLEDNMAFPRHFQQKNEKEQDEKLIAYKFGDIWNDSTQSREQVEANLQSKQEAALRRERALAYAYTHQKTQRHPSKATNPTFTDPNNPQRGWSSLERRMASRLWEDKSAFDKEFHSVHNTAMIPTNHATSVGEYDHPRPDFDLKNVPSPTAHKQSQSSSTPRPNPGRIRLANPRRSSNVDGDSRNIASAQSDRGRRHSISSIRDHESLARFPPVPSDMTSKESAKTTKFHLPSPLGFKNNGTPEKGTGNSAKKRLSFSTSPRGPRRHSDPQS